MARPEDYCEKQFANLISSSMKFVENERKLAYGGKKMGGKMNKIERAFLDNETHHAYNTYGRTLSAMMKECGMPAQKCGRYCKDLNVENRATLSDAKLRELILGKKEETVREMGEFDLFD